MLSPTIPHPGYTRAKWGFDNIKYEIFTLVVKCPCFPPCLCNGIEFLHVKTLPLGQLVGIKCHCSAPLYPGWGIVGLNIDRCIRRKTRASRKADRQFRTCIYRPSGSCHSAQQLLASSLSFYLCMHICTLTKSQVSEALHSYTRDATISLAITPLLGQRLREDAIT